MNHPCQPCFVARVIHRTNIQTLPGFVSRQARLSGTTGQHPCRGQRLPLQRVNL